ncbi:uncharacterized protein LOC110721916 [Chenopodium quinoa]|uniref:uncharacterized protein LOC110721916 n=1 Tax=Chenopodium quinoa TaxID=63459 RepID=UPI000B76DE0D|nr:uncharacterized protein LOC110721916 [Chenopodium quinoa]
MHQPEQAAKWIQYSKHTKHPLKEVYKNSKFECKCCKTESRGMRYRCDQCNFDTHLTCGTCLISISSFTHPKHTLQLMEKPNLPFHKCNLCQNYIKGMVYRCKKCSFFVHPVCSQLPEYLVKHDKHPPHSLKLQLMLSSKCDVCEKSCKHWRYFCEICDVHIHVGCLSGKIPSDDDDEGGFGLLGEVLGGILGGIAEGLLSS